MSSAGPLGDPPRRADAVRNRQRALEATQQLLAARGSKITIEDIACRAGIGAGTVVRTFGGKEALIDAASADLLTPMVQRARDALVDADVEAALRRFLTELVTFVAGHRVTGQQLEELELPLTDALLSSLHEAVRVLVDKAQQAGVVRADLDAAAVTELISEVAHAIARPTMSGLLLPGHGVSFIMNGLKP